MKSTTKSLSVALIITLLVCVVSQQYFLATVDEPCPTRELDKLPPDLNPPKLSIPNSCFMSSINLKGAYIAYCTVHKYHYWAKLLLMEQISKKDPKVKLAHVVCVFEYFGHFYVYDVNHGVYPLLKADIRRAAASAVALAVKHPEGYTLGESLWVEES